MQHPLPPRAPTAWGRPTGGEEDPGMAGGRRDRITEDALAGRQGACACRRLKEPIPPRPSSLESPRPLSSKWKRRINFLLGAQPLSFFFPTRPQTLPISPIKLLLTEPFKLQCRILHCLIHLTQPQLIKLDAIWWESTGVIRGDGDTLDSLPEALSSAPGPPRCRDQAGRV